MLAYVRLPYVRLTLASTSVAMREQLAKISSPSSLPMSVRSRRTIDEQMIAVLVRQAGSPSLGLAVFGSLSPPLERLRCNPVVEKKVEHDRCFEPRSGARMQPTAQAVGRKWNKRKPRRGERKERLRHGLFSPVRICLSPYSANSAKSLIPKDRTYKRSSASQ